MSSPLLWGPNNLANNLENGQILSGGTLINQNGSPNYCTFGNFANGLSTGWSLGAISGSLTNGIPVTGTNTPTFGSGSTGLSIPIVSSSQSAQGSAFALKYTATSATTVGNMLASDPLTLPTSNQANVVTFKGYFNVISLPANGIFGGTSGDSFGVAFWDVTNSAWIGNTSNFPFTQTTGVGFFTGTFQPSITTTQVRLVIYNVNATSGAIAIDFTDFYVGPVTAPLGAVVTDWQSYLMTIGGSVSAPTKGTPTIDNAQWRRVGDSMELRYDYRQSSGGADGSGVYLFPLPPGYSVNTSIVPADPTSETAGNVGSCDYQSGSGVGKGWVFVHDSTHLAIIGDTSPSTLSPTAIGSTFYQLSASPITYSFFARIPIVGWSSNVQMSNDTDTRIISWNGTAGSQSVTGGVTDIAFTTVNDRTGSWNGTQFKVPVSGDYVVSGSMIQVTTGAVAQVFLNGSFYNNGYFGTASSTATSSAGSILVTGCKAGDLLSLRANATATISLANLGIFRLSGPSVIAATESVNGRYFSSTSTVTSSLATIIYATKGWDTHNAYNVSTGIWTAPVSGKYQFNASAVTTGTYILNNAADIQIQQTGSSSQISEQLTRAGGAVAFVTSNVSDEFYCLAGDTIKIQLACGATGPTIAASNNINFFSWSRVGN